MHVVRHLDDAARKIVKSAARPVWDARFRKAIARFAAPYRLHLGCGSHHLDGWVNIDFIRTPAVDVLSNLGRPFPLEDGSCRYIFHEHVLEHFELKRGMDLLRECHRLLRPRGVLRVAMPSLDEMLANCQNGGWRSARGAHMPEVKTRAEYLNVMFRFWGHRWIYDREELHRRLHEAGFRQVLDAGFRQSAHPELSGIEHRDDSLLICEAVKGSD